MRRIIIVGAGHVGFYVAERLSGKLRGDIRRGAVEVMVIDPNQHMTYQPFLPEAAAGHISPRHGVIPLRHELRRCRIVAGTVTRVSTADRSVTVQPIVGPSVDFEYDQLVLAPGSVSRTLPIPGLADNAVGFKTMGEAIYLRNHVLQMLDVAAATADPQVRRRALNFVFIGGGFAGIEAMAELEDMVRRTIGAEMGAYTVEKLIQRGFDIRLNTLLKSCEDGHVVLSDGEEFDSDTIVWTAGVKPHPMLRSTDLPLGPKGHIRCLPTLQVTDDNGVVPGVWAAGDSAQVPDLSGFTEYCTPNAQHAVRQAKVLADNIARALHGHKPVDYLHKYVGSVASLGLHKGVAHVYGIKGKGLIAWLMHRSYHLMRVPGFGRKVRVVADWTLALITSRETVQLGELHDPRKPWEQVASGHTPGPNGDTPEPTG